MTASQSNPSELNALCVIPARFASTRLPGKPLLAETGKPLIQHVVENAQKAQTVSRVVVATDDQRIFDAVVAFGAEAVMTGEHPNGTSRIAEAVATLETTTPTTTTTTTAANATTNTPFDLIVNVQGDEPEVPPSVIDQLVQGLAEDTTAQMATLSSPFDEAEEPRNPNVVKVVCNQHNRAMYFSRSMIPYDRDAEFLGTRPSASLRKHPGLYAYRRPFLKTYPTLTPTPLEEAEKLEQLRVLEHGYDIAVIHVNAPEPGIDTPEQYEAFVKRYREHNG